MIHRLFKLLLPIALTSGLLHTASISAQGLSAQLPDIGAAGSSVLSPREERLLGREFMRSVRKSLKLVDDPIILDYLQGLSNRLISQISDGDHEITAFLVDDPAINAFAGPGGYIGIHTGLILAARNEGELASVLAHEIAHVTQRHLVRSFEASNRMSLPTLGAIIAAIVLGASNPEVGEAVLASTMAGSVQQQLTYSRSHEQEADRIGLDLMVSAGIDPHAMVSFFEILQNQHKLAESSAPEFLRTHPLTISRIADIKNRAEQFPTHSGPDNTTFQLIQVRAAIYSQKGREASSIDESRKFSHLNQTARRYYRALAAAKAGQYPQARKIMDRLMQSANHRVLNHTSAIQIELADNQLQQAQKILTKALNLFPGNLLLIELQAETHLRLQRPSQAFDLLKAALRKYPEYHRLYPLYAKSAKATGEDAEAYRSLAELHYAQGDTHQAIDHLTHALKTPNLSQFDRLSIEARLKALKTEVREYEQAALRDQESRQIAYFLLADK